MLMNVPYFQNYAHKHPIILELFSLKSTYYSQNYAGILGSSLVTAMFICYSYCTIGQCMIPMQALDTDPDY